MDNIFNGLIGEVIMINLKGKIPTITVKFEGIITPVIYEQDDISEYLMPLMAFAKSSSGIMVLLKLSFVSVLRKSIALK